MSAIWASVAGTSFQPTLQMRSGEFPTMTATFIATLLSYLASNSGAVSQSASGGYQFNPASSQMYRSSSSRDLNGT